MSEKNQCLVSKDRERLQIPYSEYAALMQKVEELKRLRSLRDEVVTSLSACLGEKAPVAAGRMTETPPPVAKPEPKAPEPAPEPDVRTSAPSPGKVNIDVPPIKKDIAAHFNRADESGRLFSVFQQYYACLNDACGGTVRVTMKDGVCSMWNYDEWEEFAFIDIFEGCLRVCIDSRYTDQLKSLKSCDAPRLLAGRGSLLCIRVDDLNNTMLDVMAKAFREVGLATS